MKYNLTDKQKDLAKLLVANLQQGKIHETFAVDPHRKEIFDEDGDGTLTIQSDLLTRGSLDALAGAALILQDPQRAENGSELFRYCTVTAGLAKAVETEFSEEPTFGIPTPLTSSPPPEISASLARLRAKYPETNKLGFLIMRFAAEKPYERIVTVIKQKAAEHGLTILRADDHQFHSNLLSNVRTYLHGCGFGIAIYERIKTDEPNANVGLEVGYLMAMNKPVLLLKDRTAETLQTDLAGELYKEFDPHNPEDSIPQRLNKWLEDYGIIVPQV